MTATCVPALPVTNLLAIVAVCIAFGWCGWWAGRGLIESERSSRERFAALLCRTCGDLPPMDPSREEGR